MPICVFSLYTKSLVASSPCTHRFFPRIWRQFCVPQTTLHSPYSPCSLKYIPCILHGHLNAFRVFFEYAERRKNYAERNFHFQKILGTLKGQHFKKIEWGLIHLPRMNSFQIPFFGNLFKRTCSKRIRRIH
jgi:hypothetical protein